MLSIPWALTPALGVVAHWLLGELIARDNTYYIIKQHAVRAFLATAKSVPSDEEVLSVWNVDETVKDAAYRKSRVDHLFPGVTWLERLTFIFLLLSIIVSLTFLAIDLVPGSLLG